jgi:small subunit ribosomal protein S4
MKRSVPSQARDRRKLSPYGEQLLEKQRLRGYYEVLEKQFRNYVDKALASPELTGEKLVADLECRLDNMVYRMNFGASIRQARQIVTHGNIWVNGKKVDRPSYALSVGDVVEIKDRAKDVAIYKHNFHEKAIYNLPYIEYDLEGYKAVLVENPTRENIPIEINDHLVVEYYSSR